jgi:hypothetical protein
MRPNFEAMGYERNLLRTSTNIAWLTTSIRTTAVSKLVKTDLMEIGQYAGLETFKHFLLAFLRTTHA